MKAILKPNSDGDRAFLNFDRLIPLFPRTEKPCFWTSSEMTRVISRTQFRPRHSERMIALNRDSFPVEFSNLARGCRQFADEVLWVISGVEKVIRGGDYQLWLEVGVCFDINEVGRAVAQSFLKCFYPEEILDYSLDLSQVRSTEASTEDVPF